VTTKELLESGHDGLQHFSRSQAKRIHPNDLGWLEAGEPQA
jgi:hypothetical protein